MPGSHSRKRRHWEGPVSPLQAARYERRWTGQEAIEKIRAMCDGHSNGLCMLDASKLSDYERGMRHPSVRHIIALAKVYQKSPEELGLITWRDPQPQPENTPEQHRPDAAAALNAVVPAGDLFLRLLRPILGAAAASSTWDEPTGPIDADPLLALIHEDQERLAATKLGNHQLQRLEIAADHYARTYYQLAEPAHARGLLLIWTIARRSLTLPQTLTQRRTLTNAYGRLSGILASLAFDHGHPVRALAFLEISQDAASETGDTDLVGWLYALHSKFSDWDSNHQQVLALTERGLAATGTTATLTAAKLHSRTANAYAALGDQYTVIVHLKAAAQILESPTAGCWPSDPSMPRGFTCTADTFALTAAKSHLRLGDHTRAVQSSEEAATLQHQQGLSPRTALAVPLNQLNLAAALLQRGEPDHACAVARTAIERYRGVATSRLLHRADALARDIITTHPKAAFGREFTEFVREHSRGQQLR